MNVSDFYYDLPEELIAQTPIEKRDESRLMVLNRANQTIEHKTFKDIIDYLEPGDCLVRNNTKVIPARLYGKKATGAKIEFLLLNRIEGDIWECIVRPGHKLKPGTEVEFGDGILKAKVLDVMEGGTRKVEFKYEGSAAAPTAGLHFTPELFEKIKAKGIDVANVTLHVGIGTFRPVKVENVEEHHMHSEHFYIKQEDADKINNAKKNGKRVIAVGTTSCRVLETIADENGMVKPTEGDTQIFIYPGYKYKCLDGLVTNFHLPESTLIMLVSALAGRDYIMKAYNEAVKERYRFFSFGDAMLIL